MLKEEKLKKESSKDEESFNSPVDGEDTNEGIKTNKRKKSGKHKKSVKGGEEDPPNSKKLKKSVCRGAENYKPGMLSDLLQKQKYGYVILPWDSNFGKDQPPQCNLDSIVEGIEQEKIKINPLFDPAKICKGNTVLQSSQTYTVFIGNLPQEVTINRVKKIFKKLSNTITKIKIRSDEKRSKQNIISSKSNYKHATVKFNTLESYEAALKMNGKLFNGHHLRITGDSKTTSDPEKSIFIGNLAVGTTDDMLWKAFENCGEIDSVRVIKDKVNKKGMFGYVNFQSAESVDEALKLDGTSVLDREIRVNRINKNVDSLSNSVTVKRNRKKQSKSLLNNSNNKAESKKAFDTSNKEQRKSLKSSNHTSAEAQEEIQQEISVKKKKKKKRPAEVTEGDEFGK